VTSTAAPRLAHVAVVVRDLGSQGAIPADALGLAVRDRTAVPDEGAAVAFLPVGQAEVELIQPLSPTGPLARFLEREGGGIHHIAMRVPDVGAAVARAAGAGLRFAGPAPRLGAHGTRIAFLHPSSAHGVLVELIEDSDSA
jgi:methylmalonyl-CoA/ethylmalonyl-CoA epimerase